MSHINFVIESGYFSYNRLLNAFGEPASCIHILVNVLPLMVFRRFARENEGRVEGALVDSKKNI